MTLRQIRVGVAALLGETAHQRAMALPVGVFRKVARLPTGSWQVLTWGGLRGGISVALAFAAVCHGARYRAGVDLFGGYLFDSGPRPQHRCGHAPGDSKHLADMSRCNS